MGDDVATVLLGKMEAVIEHQQANAVQLAAIQAQIAARDRTCDRQNDRLDAVFAKIDSHDERIGKVDCRQASIDGGNSEVKSWLAILLAGLAVIVSWLKHG